jgi:hypothetical protein
MKTVSTVIRFMFNSQMMSLIVWIVKLLIQPHLSVYLQRVNPIKKKPFSVMREIMHNDIVDKITKILNIS